MSKSSSDFDPSALCAEVLKQDIGLAVTTNDAATFKRRLYDHMRANPGHKIRILTGTRDGEFHLVKPSAEVGEPA